MSVLCKIQDTEDSRASKRVTCVSNIIFFTHLTCLRALIPPFTATDDITSVDAISEREKASKTEDKYETRQGAIAEAKVKGKRSSYSWHL